MNFNSIKKHSIRRYCKMMFSSSFFSEDYGDFNEHTR